MASHQPPGPILQPVRADGPHHALTALVALATALIVGAGVLGRIGRPVPALPLPATSGSASPSAPASPGIALPQETPAAPATVSAIVAAGWPVTGVGPLWSEPVVAPDGTAYVVFEQGRAGRAQLVAIDASGHMRPGWPFVAPPGETLAGPALGSDGTVWVTTSGTTVSSPRVVALAPDGTPRTGWPVEVPWLLSSTAPVPGPDGSAYVVEADAHGLALLLGLSRNGVLQCFPLTLDGSGEFSYHTGVLVAADGTVYATSTSVDDRGEALRVVALRTAGCSSATFRMGGQTPGATLLPDGRLLAWTFDISPRTLGVGPAVRALHLAVIGPNGQAAPGWPQVLRGVASAPSVGPDGTVYVTVGTSCSASSGRIVALRANGTARPGWPASLPPGFGGAWLFPQSGQPCVASRPVVDASGGVRALVGDPINGRAAVDAIDPAGRAMAGWPYRIAAAGARGEVPGLGGAFLPVAGPNGSVFQALGGPPGSVIALDAHGHVVGRQLLGQDQAIAGVEGVPGGRLLVTAVTRSAGFPIVALLALGPYAPAGG